jgi:hypothetical protein
VQVVGQRDGNGVDVGLFEQLAVIGVAAGDVITSTSFAGTLRIGFAHGHRSGSMAVGQTVKMVEAESSRSDDGTTKLVCHNLVGISQLPLIA